MNAIEITGLRKVYDNGFEALKGIDLCIKEGDFFALLGANGAGKSTTIGLISTLITKTSGSIFIEGIDLYRDPERAKRKLGLVPQETNLNVFETPEQILVNQAGFYGISRRVAWPQIEVTLEQLGLSAKRHAVVRTLSGGMKHRLMIARALVHQPRILILDEPTAGVDIAIRHRIWHFLKQLNQAGTTIILTTHYLEEAERLCKTVAIIDNGEIIANKPMNELLTTLKHQTFVLHTQTAITTWPTTLPFEIKIIDSHSFELRFGNEWSLNAVFEILSQQGITITSLTNKTTPLEALFEDLTNHDN